MSKVSDEQIKIMRETFQENFDVLTMVSRFLFELDKAMKDFEVELDSYLKEKAALEDNHDLPM